MPVTLFSMQLISLIAATHTHLLYFPQYKILHQNYQYYQNIYTKTRKDNFGSDRVKTQTSYKEQIQIILFLVKYKYNSALIE